jgi:methylenetetrahydrofolate dehydrogenase (NADP+)/methenyltetrahydrofolate cyclohydrolase
MQRIDGNITSQQIRKEIAEEVSKLKAQGKKTPHLAAILVGSDGGSVTYVNAKINDCKEIGFDNTLITLPGDVSEEMLLKEVEKLNDNADVDGFIVQLPLPKHIDEQKVISMIRPDKDVDGFHPQNYGRMALGLDSLIPATPLGITELIRRYNIDTDGKHCVVIGRSHIVGFPISILMGQNTDYGNCTVTLTHSHTQNLKKITKTADILIAAIGRPNFVTGSMVKEGAVVIDVGTTRIEDHTRERGWRLCGDVNFSEVAPKCSHITPVPGGVGPMTRAGLLQNLMKTYRKRYL